MSEEIEQLIHSHAGPIVVQIVEPVLGNDLAMEALAAEIRQWRADAQVVGVAYSLHREWARRYRVHGSPCTLVFQSGAMRVRLKGRVASARLRAVLEKAGLL